MTEGYSQFIWRTFAPGTHVVVGEGPLQGLRGTVVGVDENHHLIVSVMLLRRPFPVKLDPIGLYLDDEASAGQLLKH